MSISVIIPAAGLAKRMRPLSSNSSKAMIPVNGKPIIAYILDEVKKIKDLNKVVIVENKLHDIKDFVEQTYSDMNVHCVEQKNPEGPLHAINVGFTEMLLNDPADSIFVWLGDTIVTNQYLDFDTDFLGTARVKDQERWCLVDDKLNYYDKPNPDDDIPTDKALVGLYYFKDGSKFAENLYQAMHEPKQNGEYQISTLLDKYTEFFLEDTSNNWYDCGELNTYYESKARLINNSSSSRDFNSMKVSLDTNTILKTATGPMAQQVENEKNWYNSLNEIQSLFTPRILSSNLGELRMSWESGTTLSEIFLYEKMGKDNWTLVINKLIDTMHGTFYNIQTTGKPELDAAYEMYVNNAFKRISDIKLLPSSAKDGVHDFVKEVGVQSLSRIKWSDTIHGDLHFGNILFEPFNGSFKLVDPRGNFGGLKGTAGDMQYDFAKLLHDWVGGYILINNGYDPSKSFPNEEIFYHIRKQIIKKMGSYFSYDEIEHIIKLSIFLCITCVPLHSDKPEKQKLLLKNSIKNITGEVWVKLLNE